MESRKFSLPQALVVGLSLIFVWAAVVSTWSSGGSRLPLFGAVVAYSLVLAGLALGTVRVARRSGRRTRMAIVAGLALLAVWGVVDAVPTGQTAAVGVAVILYLVWGAVVVGGVSVAVRLVQRWRHGGRDVT